MDKYSFEELKMMYESAEKVTDRRLSNNKTNYSISIGIIITVSVIWKWTIENPNYFFCGLLLVLVLTGIATIFCSLWIGQIKDFKNLNKAKYEVINEMAQNLDFDSSNSDINLKSYVTFAKEWQKLSQINALQVQQENNIIALKSTNTEYFVPKAFRIIFGVFFLISVLTIVLNPSSTWSGVQFLLHINK